MKICLEGNLSINELSFIADGQAEVCLSEKTRKKLEGNRKTLENIISERERPIYGVTTGFGDLVKEEIPNEQLRQLQVNLLRSHSAGVGDPFSPETVRAILALRANSLGRGFSGVRPRIVELLVDLLNENVIPYVPNKGSLGASGDLIPLAHASSVLIGEGKAYYEGELLSGKQALKRAGLQEVGLKEKEGLALINGTQAMTAVAALSLKKAESLLKLSDLISSLTVYILGGNFAQFDPRIFSLRPHQGQKRVAKNLRAMLEYKADDYIPKTVQDPYSLRCIPQVHGSVRKAFNHTKEVVVTEMNSVTDNPLIFSEPDSVISGGNFHGEPVALVADYLTEALTDLGNLSERRVNRMLHPNLNGNLPDFLTEKPGTNSGLMLAQYTAAALTSENKNLAFPSTVDSIPVSGDQEDHVSMGMHAAKNLEKVVENLTHILGVELFVSAQAKEFTEEKLPEPLDNLYSLVREKIPPIKEDRELSSLIDKTSSLISKESLWTDLLDNYDIN